MLHYTAVNCSLCSGASQTGAVASYYHLSADSKGKLIAIENLQSETVYNYTLTVFNTVQEQASKHFTTSSTHVEGKYALVPNYQQDILYNHGCSVVETCEMNLAVLSAGIAVAVSVPVTGLFTMMVTCLCCWLRTRAMLRHKLTSTHSAEHALQNKPSVLNVTENVAYECIQPKYECIQPK